MRANLSNAVNAATATASSVRLIAPTGTPIPLQIGVSGAQLDLKASAGALPGGTRYTLHLSAALRDSFGQALDPAAETTFTTQESRWEARSSSLASLASFTSGLAPSVAVDLEGTVLAAWSERQSNRDSIYVVSKRGAANWTAPLIAYQAAEANGIFEPQLTAEGAATFHLTWVESVSGSRTLMMSHRGPSSTSWSTPVQLNAVPPGATPYSFVAVSAGAGSLTVLANTLQNVVVTRRNSSGQWTVPQVLAAPSTTYIFNLRAAADDSGNVTAAWIQDESSGRGLYAAQYLATASGWGPAVRLGNASSGAGNRILVAMDGTGGAAIVHANAGSFSSDPAVEVATKAAGMATWSGLQRIDTAASGAVSPAIGFDQAGNLTIAWLQADGLYVARRPAGGPWSAPVRIGVSSSFESGSLRLVADVAGNVTLNVVEHPHVRSFGFSSTTQQWTAVPSISTPELGSPVFVGDPALALDATGTVTSVWFAHHGDEYYVSSNQFR